MMECDLTPGGFILYAVGFLCEQLLDLMSFGQLSRGFCQAEYCSSFLEEIYDILLAIVT
jgi:hypothetical protein